MSEHTYELPASREVYLINGYPYEFIVTCADEWFTAKLAPLKEIKSAGVGEGKPKKSGNGRVLHVRKKA